jgi:hypothetical protein
MNFHKLNWEPSLTAMLALYGAVISTVTALIQLSNHIRDRAKIKLAIRKNMSTNIPRFVGLTFTIVTATNIGRRPVTINGFAAKLLFKKGIKATDWYLPEVSPVLPCEITEGKEVSAFANETLEEFKRASISYWYAWDSTGRFYRLNVAPWYKRWLSNVHYRFSLN